MRWGILFGQGRQDLRSFARSNVDQHVSVGEALHGTLERWFAPRMDAVNHFSTVILFKDLLISDMHHPIIIKAQPSSICGRLDEDKVVTAVNVSGMNQNSVKVIDPTLALISISVQIRAQID